MTNAAYSKNIELGCPLSRRHDRQPRAQHFDGLISTGVLQPIHE